MEETSSSAGAVALILGILSLAGAIVSLVVAFGGGAFGMCCPMFGFIASFVPLVAGVLALIGAVFGVIVFRRPALSDEDNSPTLAGIGLALSLISLLVDGVSLVIALGPSLMMMFLSIVNAIANG